MSTRKTSGDDGEKEVVKKVPCLNCNKSLMRLPESNPLYDVQCTSCSFRAQIKTSHSKPRPSISGSGWNIMDKVLKSGFLAPPLILNFKWTDAGEEKQEIQFYPFVPRKNLKKRFTKIKKSGRELWMFDYIGMNDIKKNPYFVLFQK